MKLRTVILSTAGLLLAMLLFITPASAQVADLRDEITGTWEGEGHLMGNDSSFRMQWEKVLGNRFMKLEYRISREAEGGPVVLFDAIALYRLESDSTWRGTWFDNRGITFPVNGQLEGYRLTVEWGTEAIERGRTIYLLESDSTMKVTDYVLRGDTYEVFAESSFDRVHPGEER